MEQTQEKTTTQKQNTKKPTNRQTNKNWKEANKIKQKQNK